MHWLKHYDEEDSDDDDDVPYNPKMLMKKKIKIRIITQTIMLLQNFRQIMKVLFIKLRKFYNLLMQENPLSLHLVFFF